MSARTLNYDQPFFICKSSLHFYDLFLAKSSILASCSCAINFMNACFKGKLCTTKLWRSDWKVGFWMQQENQCCIDKCSSTKPIYDKWNHFHSHSWLYLLLFTVSGIPYCMYLSVKWICYSISYSYLNCLYCYHIVY